MLFRIQSGSGNSQTYKVVVTANYKDGSGQALGSPKSMVQTQVVENGSGNVVSVDTMTIPANAGTIEYAVQVYDSTGKLVEEIPGANNVQTILPAIPLAVHSSYIRQTEGGTLSLPLAKETHALSDKGEIRVTVESSLVGAGLAQLNKRIDQDEYADLFVESRIWKALIKGSAADPKGLATALSGLQPFMDSAGFVKYYTKADRGSIWLTAAFINALATESWAIAAVPTSISDQWKAAILAVLNKSVDPLYLDKSSLVWSTMRAQNQMAIAAMAFDDSNLQALATQVADKMAANLAANPAAYGAALDKWDNSALVDYWTLQTLINPESAMTSPIYKMLTGPARMKYSNNYALLIGRPQTAFDNFYSDETIETAQLLAGLARVGTAETKETARALAIGLLNASSDAWYVARSLAWTGQGLKVFGSAYQKDPVTGTTTVVLAQDNQRVNIAWSPTRTTGSLVAPWAGPTETLQVTQVGTGQPWVAVQALTAVPLTKAYGEGLALTKEIRNLNRTAGYKAGDVIEVTLTINATNQMKQVAMIDPIPSGSNILADGYGAFDAGEKSYKGYKFYFSYLPEGSTQVKYQYQLNNVGSFNLPPTRAEGLFMPSVYGEAPNASMTVEAQQ